MMGKMRRIFFFESVHPSLLAICHTLTFALPYLEYAPPTPLAL